MGGRKKWKEGDVCALMGESACVCNLVARWTQKQDVLLFPPSTALIQAQISNIIRWCMITKRNKCYLVAHYLDTIVTCNETAIKVEVEKTYTIRRNEDILHLKDFRDPACNLTKLSNRTHVVAVMSLGTCGTNVEVQHAKL